MLSRFSCLAALLVLCGITSRAGAQVVTYSFEGDVSTPATTASNVTASDFTLGPSVANASSGPYVGGSPGRARNTSGYATAFTADDYVEVVLTAASGYELDLSSLAADLQRSTTGPASIELRTSADGFAAAVGPVVAVPTAFGTSTFDLSGASFQNLAAITLRLYGYGASSAGGTLRFDDVTVGGTVEATGGAGESASVTFAPTSATVAEGGMTTVNVVLAISNEQGNDGLDTDVSGTVVVPAANAGDVSFSGSFTFTAGTADGAMVSIPITATDDADFEGDEMVPFTFGTVSGGTGSGSFALTITDNDPAPAIVINEIDTDTPGSDAAEFIELAGSPGTPLDAFVLVGYNGGVVAGDANKSYFAFDLDGQSLGADGLFVLCGQSANVPGCDLEVAPGTNLLQQGGSGAADGVALYIGSAADFPNGTFPTTANLVDAIVYNTTSNTLGGTLAAALGEPVEYVENYNGQVETQSLSRIAAATGPTELFYVLNITPGAPNVATVTVDRTTDVEGAAGYRLFSAPVLKPNGTSRFNVDDLAAINLVQDVAGGSDADGTYGPQYPAAPGPNLYLGYDGTAFQPAATTADDLVPGAGFFWQLYNQDITPTSPTPYGEGTSQSYTYDPLNPAFVLALTGVPVENADTMTPYAVGFTQHTDGFYLLGNPFVYPFYLGGVTASGGTFQTTFQTYDGTSYQPREADFTTPSAGAVVAPWQGFFAESADLTGTAVFDVRYDSRYVAPTQESVDLVGRPAGFAGTSLHLGLTGRTATGADVYDRAAIVRVAATASAGWDLLDASKLTPPAGPYALLALVGTRGGAAHRQAVLSLPAATGAMALAFTATHAGTYTITAEATDLPATATLRDLVTGDVATLTDGYTFTSDATDWTDRFVVSFGRTTAGEEVATARSLSAPRPNPAMNRAAMTLRLPAAEHVRATVVDALGRSVATLYDAEAPAGADIALDIDTARLAPGVYVVRVQGTTFTETRRLTVVR